MIFTSSALALTLIALLPSTIASPIEKRFNNAKIRSGQSNLCLSTTPKDGPADGTLLYLRDCKSASTSTWKITPGYGSVILANSGVTVKTFALDAGVPQVNNARPKIMTSTPGVTQQSWFVTGDNRIAYSGGYQCLGLDTTTGIPKISQCVGANNSHQIWYIDVASS